MTYVYLAHFVHLYFPSSFSQLMQILSAGIMGAMLGSVSLEAVLLFRWMLLNNQFDKEARFFSLM